MTSVIGEHPGGSERALEALYVAHKPAVYRTALRMVGNRHDAEEITQDTFLNAYRALLDGTSPRAPRAWLLAIARNMCRARWRRNGCAPQEVPLQDELPATENDTAAATDFSAALGRLLPRQRAVFVLHELRGLSDREIAVRLQLSESAVHTLLFRARTAMREELEAARHALTCAEIGSLLATGQGAMSRLDRDLLRAHLRRCAACAVEARSRRARRGLRGLVLLPFDKLFSWLGPTSAPSVSAAKIAAMVGVAAFAAGAATTTVPGHTGGDRPPSAVASAVDRSGAGSPAVRAHSNGRHANRAHAQGRGLGDGVVGGQQSSAAQAAQSQPPPAITGKPVTDETGPRPAQRDTRTAVSDSPPATDDGDAPVGAAAVLSTVSQQAARTVNEAATSLAGVVPAAALSDVTDALEALPLPSLTDLP